MNSQKLHKLRTHLCPQSMVLETAGNFSDYYWYLGATSSPDLQTLFLLAHLLQRTAELFEYLQQDFGEFSTYSVALILWFEFAVSRVRNSLL